MRDYAYPFGRGSTQWARDWKRRPATVFRRARLSSLHFIAARDELTPGRRRYARVVRRRHAMIGAVRIEKAHLGTRLADISVCQGNAMHHRRDVRWFSGADANQGR